MRALALAAALVACRGAEGPNHEPEHGNELGAPEPAAVPEQPELGTLPVSAVPRVSTAITDGLALPETVIVDPEQDVYFVSNVNGDPAADDRNGYVSKISPSGAIIDRYFIDGRVPGVDLSSPRGMALGSDTLYVVDLHAIRLFDRTTGTPRGAWPIPNAQFLDHLAVDGSGHVFASDIGVQLLPTGPVKSGAAVIYEFDPDGRSRVLASGDELHGPTGLAIGSAGVIAASLMDDEHGVYAIDARGAKHLIATLPFGELDGVAVAPDGSLLVSSWLASAVYRVVPGEPPVEIVQYLTTPAAIAYDARRGRILIPELMANTLRFETWSPPGAQSSGNRGTP